MLLSVARADAPVPAMPDAERSGDVVIDVGSREAAGHLGFGWSGRERLRGGGGFQWVERMEADVWVDLERATSADLWVRAAPLYLSYRRQNIGLYVNGRFLREWVCPDDPGYRDYHALIPAGLLREGRNRLILRMGYQKQMGRDTRALSLAVDTIVLSPRVE